MIRAGSSGVAGVYVGSSPAQRLYVGSSLIWESSPVADPTVHEFVGDTLPDGWTEVVPTGAGVEMAGEYLRLTTPAGANMDCLSSGVPVPQGPYVWLPVSGSFDFAVAIAEEPTNLRQQGLDLLALDGSGSGGARFCIYAPNFTTASFRNDVNYYVYEGKSKSTTGNTSQLYGAPGWLRVTWDGATYSFYQSRSGASGSWVLISAFTSSFIPTQFAIHANGVATGDTTNGREQRIARVVDLLARGTDDARTTVPEVTSTGGNTFDGVNVPAWGTVTEANGGTVSVVSGNLELSINNAVAGSSAQLVSDTSARDHGWLLRYQVNPGYVNAFWVAGVGLEPTTDVPGAVVVDDKWGAGNLMLMEMPARQLNTTAGQTVRMLRRSPVPVGQAQTGNREFDGYSMLIEDLAFPVSTDGGPWTWMRLEKVGPRTRVRIWYDGDPEPVAWSQEIEDYTRRGTMAVLSLGSNDTEAGGSSTAKVRFSDITLYLPS